jgi:hypothetical protein
MVSNGDRFRTNYGFLDSFFTEVIAERQGRRLLVGALYDGDLGLRDAFALVHLLPRLRHHRALEVVYVRAYSAEPDWSLAKTDVLYIGRPKPFVPSRLSVGKLLEAQSVGQWCDPTNGKMGNSIRYGERTFTRHELPTPPDEHYRRCDKDYGVLLFRRNGSNGPDGDHDQRLAALAGLSTLATAGLALILCDDTHRRELIRQVQELAPWHADMRPEEWFEICVQISVAGEDGLKNFLNRPDFRFRVEAVAVAEGGRVMVRPPAETEFELLRGTDGGGIVRLAGGEVPLSALRCQLVLHLRDRAQRRSTIGDICRALYDKDTYDEKAHQKAVKLIHDTNRALTRLPGLEHSKIVHCDKRTGTADTEYALSGSWAVSGPASLPCKSKERRSRTPSAAR